MASTVRLTGRAQNGLRLTESTGANARVVEAFAFLHDSQRENEYTDHGHGRRASAYAATLRDRGFFEMDDVAFELLVTACNGHSDGGMEGDVTVRVCWDADRLDLGRVGIKPDPRRLCTAPARDLAYIDQAWKWGLEQYHGLRAGKPGRDQDYDDGEIVQQGGRYGW